MAFNYDMSDAPRQSGGNLTLIPKGTALKVHCAIKAGDHPEDNALSYSKDGQTVMCKLEFTVLGGEFDRRKIWDNLTFQGNETAIDISRQKLRAMIESLRGWGFDSPGVRSVGSLWELHDKEFGIVVGHSKAKDGYEAREQVARILTVDDELYQRVVSGGETVVPAAAAQSASGPQPQGQFLPPTAGGPAPMMHGGQPTAAGGQPFAQPGPGQFAPSAGGPAPMYGQQPAATPQPMPQQAPQPMQGQMYPAQQPQQYQQPGAAPYVQPPQQHISQPPSPGDPTNAPAWLAQGQAGPAPR